MKEGGGGSPSTLAPQILWQPLQNLIRARASFTLPSLCCSSSVQCELCFSSVLQCFRSVVFQYCSVADTAELFIQCSFSVFHSGLTLCFTVFHCISVFLYFHISVEHSVAQWADSSLSAAASKFLAAIAQYPRHPTRCRGNYLQTRRDKVKNGPNYLPARIFLGLGGER